MMSFKYEKMSESSHREANDDTDSDDSKILTKTFPQNSNGGDDDNSGGGPSRIDLDDEEDDEEPTVKIMGRKKYTGKKRKKRTMFINAPLIVEENIQKGTSHIISARYESLDYDTCENHLMQTDDCWKSYNFVRYKNFARWVIFFLIGVCTAFIGIFIDVSIEILADIKYKSLKFYLDQGVETHMVLPFVMWLGYNIVPVFIGSMLVTYVEPVALGSGIPQIKCYLNGIKMPRVVRIKTLIVKTIGVITSVVGGLAGGKEGPMIHAGSVVAAGVSQGKSTSLGKDFQILKYFREDHEKRDFVSGGAAAGVAAAFGAPVGGVLFSLEEGASFWNQSLTWRIFFASMVSTFTLNAVLSAYHGYPGELTYAGLLNFGKFQDLHYDWFELLIFVVLGVFGGLMGALYNYLNYKLTVFRIRYMSNKILKVTEAVFVAAISATVPILMIYFINHCRPLGEDPTENPVQMYCGDGKYNTLGAMWLRVPEETVRSLFHNPKGAHDIFPLSIFVVCYFFLSVWTYGVSVSAGLFIPCLLIGAAWGRLFSLFLENIFPQAVWIDQGKYALIGAAAQLGGVVRMTISLTVILIEATGNITFGLPLMLTLITSKWIGDIFTEGLYDIHIELSGIPLLPWDPPPLSSNITAKNIQSQPVVSFRSVETVGYILNVLKHTSHNGFPIVSYSNDSMSNSSEKSEDLDHSLSDGEFVTIESVTSDQSGRQLIGLILRSQLIILIKNKIYKENQNWMGENSVPSDIFHNEYPRYPNVNELAVSVDEYDFTIQIDRFMNVSPFSVQETTGLPRVFKLFRALGLRHVIVVNEKNQVEGIITRKDLARFKIWKHGGRMGLEELKITNSL